MKGIFRLLFDAESEERADAAALLLGSQGPCMTSVLWQHRLPTGQYITSLSKLNHLIYYAMQIDRNLP
jgi:hypothetical protein